MRKIGLYAFGITTAVLVPTALHVLNAGPNQVAKLVAPNETSLKIGDAKVDVSADRAIVDAGGKVHLTVTATSEKRTKVKLAVIVLESQGSGGGRVELPPSRIARDELELDVVDGKASKTVAYTLPGYRGEEMEGRAAFGHYTIFVMPPKDADIIEKLRKRAERVGNPMEDSGGQYGSFEEAYYQLGTADSKIGGADQVARVDVNTRSADSTVSIVAPDTAVAGDAIAVKVRVKNPTRYAIAQVTVNLVGKPYELSGDYKGIPDEAITIDETDGASVALGPHESKDVVFHVHTTATGTLGLFASARCEGDDCYTQDSRRTKVNDSSLDAIDILPKAEAPAAETADNAAAPAPAAAAAAAAAPAAAAPAAAPAPAAAAPKPAPTPATTIATAPVAAAKS